MQKVKTPNNKIVPVDFVVSVAAWHACLSIASELACEMELMADRIMIDEASNSTEYQKARERSCSIINAWDNDISDNFIIGRESFVDEMRKIIMKNSRKYLK